MVRGLERARRDPRADGARGVAKEEAAQRRRASAACRRLLSLREIRVRARFAADESRAPEGGGMPASSRSRICGRPASASRSPTKEKSSTASCASPRASQNLPVVVMAVGLDSAKEETEAYEQPFLARGMATLVFDGPGQGEGEYDFAIRGDYEVAGKAVFDLLANPQRYRREPRGDLGRQPRRLLRAAHRRIREARQGLYRARRAVRLGRGLGRPAGADARGVPRAQPLQDAGWRPSATPRLCH